MRSATKFILLGVKGTGSLFYERRKGITVIFAIFLLATGLFFSYKYVQAKMAETDTFSDVYILEKVGGKIALPEGAPISLVRVDDAEKLKKEHDFYKEVKEGYYIIVYPKLFVIYDAVHDEVIGIKESSQKDE
jgi:hypothetical protein